MIDDFVIKIVSSLGLPGLGIYLVYRLLDRYAGKLIEHSGRFVEAATTQSAATTQLIAEVRDAGNRQGDVLLAVRTLSSQVSTLTGWVKEVDERTKVNS